MKRFVLLAGVLLLNLLMPAAFVFAEEDDNGGEAKQELNLTPDAKSAILMERDTGKVLYEKNTEEKLAPASMTKIMTLLLIMEALDKGELKKDEMIRVSERAASMGGSQIFSRKARK